MSKTVIPTSTKTSIKKIGVIIVNYQNADETIECLESLLHSTYPEFEVSIVENGSSNDSKSKLIDWLNDKYTPEQSTSDPLLTDLILPHHQTKLNYRVYSDDRLIKERRTKSQRITLTISHENLGFAGGCNLAYSQLPECDYYWFLNPDTVVTPRAMIELKKSMDKLSKDKVGFLGCKILNFYDTDTVHSLCKVFDKDKLTVDHYPDNLPDTPDLIGHDQNVSYITGSSMFVTSETMSKIGLMDESWFLNWEEIDWQAKAKLKGYKIRTEQNAVIYHRVSTSFNSFTMGYYMTRNWFYFAQKYYSDSVHQVWRNTFFSHSFLYKIIHLRFEELKGTVAGYMDYKRGINGKRKDSK